MRTEECVCGGPPIASETLKGAGIHVAVHNADPVHIAWRQARKARLAWHFERESYESDSDLRRERPTAGLARDLSGNKPGASTARVEGAA